MPKPTYSIEAPDQPRLKTARAEIEAILKKHDLAGVCVLHTPGMLEYFYDVRPSYSCLWIDETASMLRLRSNLAQDYGGNAEAQAHDQRPTANMVAALTDGVVNAAQTFSQVRVYVDKALNAEHGESEYRPDPNEAKQH